MTSTIISNTPPFGLTSNQMVAALYAANDAILRVQAAVATAAAGYSGAEGTEFEGDSTLFGVVASTTPGEKGSDYRYAVDSIGAAWGTFWNSALAAIKAI